MRIFWRRWRCFSGGCVKFGTLVTAESPLGVNILRNYSKLHRLIRFGAGPCPPFAFLSFVIKSLSVLRLSAFGRFLIRCSLFLQTICLWASFCLHSFVMGPLFSRHPAPVRYPTILRAACYIGSVVFSE